MSLEATNYYIQQASHLLEFSDRLQKMLMAPYRVVKSEITIEKDNGEVGTFMGFRIQHNNALGPMKGGLRFHPLVNEDEVTSLASLMTWKTSLLKLPFGGAKGGVECDPGLLSETELERVTKTFTQKIKEIIGPYLDIPAPDVNTNAQVMAWIMSEYAKYSGFKPAVVTGKPVYLHGSEGREEATGLGVVIVTKVFLKQYQKNIKDTRFVIQGFGNVGYYIAKFLYELGAIVLAVSDVSGGVYDKKGLDIPALKEHVDKQGSVAGFSAADAVSNEVLLTLDCDVLIPAALGDVLNADIAKQVNCQFVIEAANGPTEPEADEAFAQRDIVVVPDILANAGGVVVSYFEWTQNIQQFSWEFDYIHQQLEKFMHDACRRVIALAKSKQCSFRTAAYIIGLGRVAKARLTMGL